MILYKDFRKKCPAIRYDTHTGRRMGCDIKHHLPLAEQDCPLTKVDKCPMWTLIKSIIDSEEEIEQLIEKPKSLTILGRVGDPQWGTV